MILVVLFLERNPIVTTTRLSREYCIPIWRYYDSLCIARWKWFIHREKRSLLIFTLSPSCLIVISIELLLQVRYSISSTSMLSYIGNYRRAYSVFYVSNSPRSQIPPFCTSKKASYNIIMDISLIGLASWSETIQYSGK